MKTIVRHILIVFVAALVVFSSACSFGEEKKNDPSGLEGSITVSGAFALYPLMVKWGEEFRKIHPNVKFNISAGGAGRGISDVIGNLGDLALVSRDLKGPEKERGAYPIAVTKDAVLPTISASNPNINEILQRGIPKESFSKLFIENSVSDWQQLGFSVSSKTHVYTRSDAAGAAESWAKYLGKKQEDLQGVGVFGDPGLLQAVLKDANAVGYNNIGYVFDLKTKQPLVGVKIIPIDINGNGVLDANENFYSNLDSLLSAISVGKYPSPPARDLFFVTHHKPTNKLLVEFIKWVLTSGQQYVASSGYVAFSKEKLEEELEKLK